MKRMEELEETTIIKCVNSIITKNENEAEEKINFSSGGSITFSLIKYPQNPKNKYILKKVR